MSIDSPVFMCPACMFRGMRPALDRKGRPYFRCEVCSAILFVRVGALGVNTVANTLRLLDVPEHAEWVRTEAYKDLGTAGQGLPALMGIQQHSAPVAGPASPTAVVNGRAASGA
jgi:hypothetical protein